MAIYHATSSGDTVAIGGIFYYNYSGSLVDLSTAQFSFPPDFNIDVHTQTPVYDSSALIGAIEAYDYSTDALTWTWEAGPTGEYVLLDFAYFLILPITLEGYDVRSMYRFLLHQDDSLYGSKESDALCGWISTSGTMALPASSGGAPLLRGSGLLPV